MSLQDDLSPAGEAFFEMVRLVNLAARPFAREVGLPYRLSLVEWRVMVALMRAPGSAAGEVAQRTGLDKMAVSRALVSLERATRVVRKPDPTDRRRMLLSLSPAGAQLFARIATTGRAREVQLFGALSPAEVDTLRRLVGRMVDSVLEAERGEQSIPPNASATRAPPE